MKKLLLSTLFALSMGGAAYAATCCNGGPCCEEGMPCCDE